MNKRILSFVLILVVSLGSFSAVSTDMSGIFEKVIEYMLRFSAADRENMFTLIKPMIVSDSGIDAIVSMIDSYTPQSKGIFDDKIGSLLKYTDKETAKKAVSSVKIIDPSIRKKYADLYGQRTGYTLSDESRQQLQYFIAKAQGKYSGLERLMTEDKITAEVIANQLKAVAEANGGKPLLTDAFSGSIDFGIYHISSSLKERAGLYLGSDAAADSTAAVLEALKKLNSNLDTDEKNKIRRLGTELGFYAPFIEAVASGVKSGEVYKKGELTIKFTTEIDKDSLPFAVTESSTIIEIAAYIGDARQPFGRLDSPLTVKIPVSGNSIMAYKFEKELLPVKYSVCTDNTLYIRIEETGYYALSHRPKYFDDANGWGGEYIESLYNRGIINGKAERTFAPEDNIKREEFVKLVVELFDIKDDKYYANFADIDHNEWYYPYVAIAYKNGIISGIGGNLFGTGQNISRQDICKILHNVIGMPPNPCTSFIVSKNMIY